MQYVSDQTPGIARRGKKGYFKYYKGGQRVHDRTLLKRINALAIPPAWSRVWISPFANSHLQATGKDARGRKQYRYHPDFVASRDETKYAHMLDFAESLPRLRKRLKADLKKKTLAREKVLAAIVTLLDETLIRVGNEDYVKKNGSFGLTTLRNRHVRVKGEAIKFLFRGKSGKPWQLAIHDRRVAKIVQSCQELPGQHLFEYRDQVGKVKAVSSSDVNAYLHAISGHHITAKDFRTWGGTVRAAFALSRVSGSPTKKHVREAITSVAKDLGNTTAVCRKCYIHPDLLSAYERGKLNLKIPVRCPRLLSPSECATLAFLRQYADEQRR